jgi:capsular polysaccharide biosynthesis protein
VRQTKILFLCKGEYRYFFPHLARILRDHHGLRPSAVEFNTASAEMSERGAAFDHVYNLAAHIKRWVADSTAAQALQMLEKFEATPGAVNINLMVAADRIVSRYPFDLVVKVMAAILDFWQELFTRDPPDVILGEVACAAEWMGWTLAQQRGIPQMIPYPPSVAGLMLFVDSPTGSWEAMAERFEAARSRRLVAEETARAEEFLRRFRQGHARATCLSALHSSPARLWHPRQLLPRLGRVGFRLRAWWEDGFAEVGSYHGTPPWEPIAHDIARPLRHFVSELCFLGKRIPEGRKLLYALHVQPEFTVNVRAPFHDNQIALIESIARSMPVGYRLLVKEHPGMKGERPLGYYRRLRALYNVDLLSPVVDSHELIRQVDVVLTITGSVAWEAILLGKPVIAFGPLCYDFYEPIFRCPNLSELPALLRDALKRFKPDHGLMLRLVNALLASAYEAEWDVPSRVPTVGRSENYRRVATAIAREVEFRLERRQRTA